MDVATSIVASGTVRGRERNEGMVRGSGLRGDSGRRGETETKEPRKSKRTVYTESL